MLLEARVTEALLEGHAADQGGFSDAAPAHVAHVDWTVFEARLAFDGVHQHLAEELFVSTHQFGVQTRGRTNQQGCAEVSVFEAVLLDEVQSELARPPLTLDDDAAVYFVVDETLGFAQEFASDQTDRGGAVPHFVVLTV